MLKKYSFLINILFVCVLVSFSLVTFYLSYQRYISNVFGKFDLGNMNQMLYNTARFNFMILTDYFGSNNIRWSMSHVDPLILILIPFNWFYSDASFLLLAQNLAFLISSLLIYKISKLYGLSSINSWIISTLIFLMPISGYILVWTTFHPSSLSLQIFFLIFLLFKLSIEKKLSNKINSKVFKALIIFLVILFMLGKEELGIVFTFFIPFFITQFKSYKQFLLKLGTVSMIWSLLCLLILIPYYTNTRKYQHGKIY